MRKFLFIMQCFYVVFTAFWREKFYFCRFLSLSTHVLSVFAAKSTSSAVLFLPNVNRTEDEASFALSPIADKTCDGSTVPEEHAEPLEAAIPAKSRLYKRASPFTPSNEKSALSGNLFSLSPFNFTPLMPDRTSSTKRSRKAKILADRSF